jgi:hypothetical protein
MLVEGDQGAKDVRVDAVEQNCRGRAVAGIGTVGIVAGRPAIRAAAWAKQLISN